jgi:hypothetical protein
MFKEVERYYQMIYQLMIITAIIFSCVFILKKDLFQRTKAFGKYFILTSLLLSVGLGCMEYKDYSIVGINNTFIYFGTLLTCLSAFIISVLNKKYGVWKIVFSIGAFAISSFLVFVAYFILTEFYYNRPYYSCKLNNKIAIDFEESFLDAYGFNIKGTNWILLEKNKHVYLGNSRCFSDSVKTVYSSDDSVAFVIYGLEHFNYKYDTLTKQYVDIINDTLAINKDMELMWAKKRGNKSNVINSLK